MNQRVSGAIEWYVKNTKDLIFTVPVAAGTNLSNYVTTNIGSMRNRGIELSLSALIKQSGTGGLGWTADFNVSHNTNELLSINPSQERLEDPDRRHLRRRREQRRGPPAGLADQLVLRLPAAVRFRDREADRGKLRRPVYRPG